MTLKDNTKEKYAISPPKDLDSLHNEILHKLDQLTKELKQIKHILHMETNDGK